MNAPAFACLDTARRRARRALFGLIVMGVGTLALLDNLHTFDTPLLRTFWPLAFVLWGVFRLVWPHHGVHRFFGLVMIVAGGLMTAHNLGVGSLGFKQWWPALLILAGVAIALRSVFPKRRPLASHPTAAGLGASSTVDANDELNLQANFGAAQVRSESAQFKGGRVAVSFGGAEVDLRQARMAGPEAVLELNAAFSGVEIRVPADWQVVVQLRATLGAVEDKTTPPAQPAHRLVLRGQATFGGVEIKN